MQFTLFVCQYTRNVQSVLTRGLDSSTLGLALVHSSAPTM
jgi:hypothetical protein